MLQGIFLTGWPLLTSYFTVLQYHFRACSVLNICVQGLQKVYIVDKLLSYVTTYIVHVYVHTLCICITLTHTHVY